MWNAPSPDKLLSDIYDAEVQPYLVGWDQNAAWTALLGRLRFDAFVYGKVVIPIGDLIDGIFFLDAANRGLLSRIPWDAIEIRSPHEALPVALFHSLRPHGGDQLKRYWFATLEPEHNSLVRARLGSEPASAIADWSDIQRFMIDSGVPAEIALRHSGCWEAIFAHLEDRPGLVVPWPPTGISEFDQSFLSFLGNDRDACCNSLMTELGGECLGKVEAKKSNRSGAWEELETFRSQAVDIDERSDLDTIECWYTTAYKRAQAQQNGCGSRDFVTLKSARFPLLKPRVVESTKPDGDHNYELPRAFLTQLGEMDSTEFDLLMRDRHRDLAAWRQSRRAQGLLNGVYALVAAAAKNFKQARVERDLLGGALAAGGASAATWSLRQKAEKATEYLSRRGFLVGTGMITLGGSVVAGSADAVERGVEGMLTGALDIDPAQRWMAAVAEFARKADPRYG